MTVSYTANVATSTGFGCFLKLLARWKGSIYKLVWSELLAFLAMYYSISAIYRFVLDPDQKKTFEAVSEYCETYIELIPLSFVLGFYVSLVMSRWWDQYLAQPWVLSLAASVSVYVTGKDEKGRIMRRTIVRYICLCLCMVLVMISPKVKKRFPTLGHFVEAGLLLESEKAIMEEMDAKLPTHARHWQPLMWVASIVTTAREEGRIKDELGVDNILGKIEQFRNECKLLLQYDFVNVPLVYTQVVTLATYSFFFVSLLGRQYLDVEDGHLRSRRNPIDYYFPILTTLQFFFYMGWLKVAESLINPFGEDDDDFEVNWFLDKNVTVSYLIVDDMHHFHPDLKKDPNFDQAMPPELPHTVASEPFRGKLLQPSTTHLNFSPSGTALLTPRSVEVDYEMKNLISNNQR